jgi:hypothetical protein
MDDDVDVEQSIHMETDVESPQPSGLSVGAAASDGDELKRPSKKCTVFNTRGLIVGVTIVAVAVILLVIFLPRRDDSGAAVRCPFASTKAASPQSGKDPATDGSICDIDDFAEQYIPAYSLRVAYADGSSPQARAFAWLNSSSAGMGLEPSRLQQRYALAVFYFSMSGESWYHSEGWLVDPNECQWWVGSEPMFQENGTAIYVPTCTEENLYSTLYLSENGLDGTIPAELEMLPHLTTLWLSAKDLYGTIPSEM